MASAAIIISSLEARSGEYGDVESTQIVNLSITPSFSFTCKSMHSLGETAVSSLPCGVFSA